MFRDREWRGLVMTLGLSKRQEEIVQRVFDDLPEVAIAHDLGLAPPTVHTYLRRLYRKLNVNSRGQLLTVIFLEFLRNNEGESEVAERR